MFESGAGDAMWTWELRYKLDQVMKTNELGGPESDL